METPSPSPDDPSPDPDALLRRVAAQRDRAAFAELFLLYAPRVGGFFARSGLDPSVRDELVQEVMLRVWRSAEQFDPSRASAATWIFAIARNARIDHLRRPSSIQRPDPLDPAWVDAHAPDAERELAASQRARHVRAALRDLPPEQAQVLEAAYFDQKTLAAIASEWGLALGTVKSRVRLAFQRLRGALDESP
jgi:RNA polymerase sigma-70 factor, ECF subfamily